MKFMSESTFPSFKTVKDAVRFWREYHNFSQIENWKVMEELQELHQALEVNDDKNIQEEIADVMVTVFAYCDKMDYDVIELINKKMSSRRKKVNEI